MGRPRPSFTRTVKPDGKNRLRAENYVCNTCGREPYQCWYCFQFTCHSCTTASPPKCDHCQRPPNDA
jgi:hypothetical protein